MVAPCLNSVMRILSDSNAGLAHLTLLYLDWLAKQLMVDTSDGAVSEKLQSSTLQRWRSRRRSRVEATFSKSCKSISRSRVKSRAAVPVHRLPESGSGDVAAVPRRRSASPCRHDDRIAAVGRRCATSAAGASWMPHEGAEGARAARVGETAGAVTRD